MELLVSWADGVEAGSVVLAAAVTFRLALADEDGAV
jgi:hypothetical protein